MIWGLVLHPGETHTEIMENEVHLSMASLECRPRINPGKDHTAHIILKTNFGEYLLCSLGYGPTPQQNLDLILQPQERMTFTVEGSGVVYLTGYTIQQPMTPVVVPGYHGNEWLEEEEYTDDAILSDNQSDIPKDWQTTEDVDVVVKGEPLGDEDNGEDETGTTAHMTSEFIPPPPVMIHSNQVFAPEHKDQDIYLDEELPVAEVDEEDSFSGSGWSSGTPLSDDAVRETRTKPRTGLQKCIACSNVIELSMDGGLSLSGHCTVCTNRLQPREGTADTLQQSCSWNRPTEVPLHHDSNQPVHIVPLNSHQQNDPVLPPRQAVTKYRKDQWNKPVHKNITSGVGNSRVKITDGGSLTCSYCRKVFKTVSGRRIHERTHTGERPYQCRFCMRGFTQSNNWQSHEKTHTGVKPHKCAFCEKTFIRTDALKSHQRIHTGEKPYQCNYCGKSYSQKILLKKHVATHCS